MAARRGAKRPAKRKRDVLHVFERDGRWWAHVPGRGRGKERVALGLPVESVSQPDAYRIAAQRFAAGGLDPRAAEAGRISSLTELSEVYMRECAARWSPRMVDNVTYRLGAFIATLESLGARTITDVTDAVLARYVESERDRIVRGSTTQRVSASTINRTIQVARRMARWAAHRKPPLCDEGALAHWRNVSEVARNRDPLIPSPDEWAALIRELEREPPPRDTPEARARTTANARGIALLVAVAVQTGLRFDELRHLRAEDIGADAVSVRAWGDWRPKDSEERDIPVPAAVAEIARELVAWRDRARGLNGRRLVLGGHWIEERLAGAWTRAKLPGDAPGMHDARRTFATEMSRRPGVSLRDVQRLLGHADLETTQRYLGRYRSDDARPAVDMGLAAILRGAESANVVPLRRPG